MTKYNKFLVKGWDKISPLREKINMEKSGEKAGKGPKQHRPSLSYNKSKTISFKKNPKYSINMSI
jgi:hypothetical protein